MVYDSANQLLHGAHSRNRPRHPSGTHLAQTERVEFAREVRERGPAIKEQSVLSAAEFGPSADDVQVQILRDVLHIPPSAHFPLQRVLQLCHEVRPPLHLARNLCRQAQLQVRQLLTFNPFCSLFYWFISHLTITIIILTTMSILNLVIHYNETLALPENANKTPLDIFKITMSKYWASMVIIIITVFVSPITQV